MAGPRAVQVSALAQVQTHMAAALGAAKKDQITWF
jgi:hypothetical protein